MKYASILLLALMTTVGANAQTGVTLFGALSNFDVLNDNGQDAYSFEIEIQGSLTSVAYTFSYTRYGPPKIVPFAGGVYVRYMAKGEAATKNFPPSPPPAVNFTPTTGH